MSRRAEHGFTLVELMMSVLIMGLITSQMFMVFSSQKQVYESNQRALDVQEDARLVVDLIAFDTRNAGFMVPRIAGISTADGGTSDPDRLCISDSSYIAYPLPGGPASVLDDRGDHFSTSKVTTLTDDLTFRLATLDVDASGGTSTNDFQVNGGVIVSNGQLSFCSQIESIDLTNNELSLSSGHEIDSTALSNHAAGLAGIRVVPAIVYELSGNDLSRNGMLLAQSVEDLQIEYWVDNQGTLGTSLEPENGQVDTSEFPVHDLNTPPSGLSVATDTIRRIRISVVTVTDRQTEGADGAEFITAGRPALANRNAGGADSLQRRTFTASVRPRNLY